MPDGGGYPDIDVTAVGITVGVLAFSRVILRLGRWCRGEVIRDSRVAEGTH